MNPKHSGPGSGFSMPTPRRTVLATALAALGASGLGLSPATARPLADKSAWRPNPAEPATAADYVSTMRLGLQAGDYLEMSYLPAGLPNALEAADFDRMRIEGRLDHVRIPANCAARADVTGRISESYLQLLDRQIALALERFERVIIDPLHHYLQWKGDYAYLTTYDDYQRVAALNADQHALRATAMWRQLALRYRDHSTRLSFDLFNEPNGGTPIAGYNPGLSNEQLLDWYSKVIPVIRNTGGRNALRMIWLEPYNGLIETLRLPANAGNIGVSPHCYTPIQYTHHAFGLSAGLLRLFTEEMRYFKEWGQANGVPIWIGEAGVSLRVDAAQVRPPAERAEFVAHMRETGLGQGTPICFWDYATSFGLYDRTAMVWRPGMREALSGLPAPVYIRPLPSMVALRGGRIARGADPASVWPGFHWDPATGTLFAAANSGGDRTVQIVFPELPVAGNQRWVSRGQRFKGSWRIGTVPFFHDARALNTQGVAGLDLRAVNTANQVVYGYRQPAPGSLVQPFPALASPQPFLAVDLLLAAGSPAGFIQLSTLRDE